MPIIILIVLYIAIGLKVSAVATRGNYLAGRPSFIVFQLFIAILWPIVGLMILFDS
jgi:hypothetical protein